jgi:hypothetical protein
MELLLLLSVAVAALLRTLAVLRVQCLAVIGELLGGDATLLLEPFGDPGLELLKFGMAVVQELLSHGKMGLHGLQTLKQPSSFSLLER